MVSDCGSYFDAAGMLKYVFDDQIPSLLTFRERLKLRLFRLSYPGLDL